MRFSNSSFFTFLSVFVIIGLIRVEIFSTLNAQPGLIHLSLGAKRTSEAASPVIVTWSSAKSVGQQFVKYGPTPETAMVTKAKKSEFSEGFVQNASLKKLKGSTKYYYRCGSDTEGWSPLYSFHSEPDSGTFRVGIIGDTQNNTNNESFQKTKGIIDVVQIYSPPFTLHMGDIVDDGSDTENWRRFLSVSQELSVDYSINACFRKSRYTE